MVKQNMFPHLSNQNNYIIITSEKKFEKHSRNC